MLHCENVTRFDFALAPAGRQSAARKLSKWKNCNAHSLHVTPPYTHSFALTLIHSPSQSKVTTLFPFCFCCFLSRWLRKNSPWFRVFLFFAVCRVLEIVHTAQSCPRALSWRESYEFCQASEYFFLSFAHPSCPSCCPPCSALNRNMVFSLNSPGLRSVSAKMSAGCA